MDFTENFFNIISDFGDDWVVKSVTTNHNDKAVYLDLEYCGEYYDPETQELAKLYDHSKQRVFRHLDIWNYSSYIRCRLPRIINKAGKIRTIRTGWSNPHDRHTFSFEIKVIDTLKATKNQTKTSNLLNCSFRLINRILHRCTQRGLAKRELESVSFEDISIDEKSFKKGHNYVTVLSHPLSGCVIDVGEHRDQESVKTLMSTTFTAEQLENVKTVSMDMWKSYINSTKEKMPQAEIVHDRFHIIKYLNTAIDKIRKREVKDNAILLGSRFALLKNEENRTVKQDEKFEEVIKSNLEVSKAYHARETFKTLFDLESEKPDAQKNLTDWASLFYMSNIKELNKVILTLLSHSRGVVNALTTSFSNAMAERLNGKIQEIKLTARGYRKFENFRSAILFFHGGLSLYPFKW